MKTFENSPADKNKLVSIDSSTRFNSIRRLSDNKNKIN